MSSLLHAVEVGSAVTEDVDGLPDALNDGEVQLGGDDLLGLAGLGQVLAPGVDDGAVAGAGGVGGGAVAESQEGLVLDGPGPGQGVQVHGPLGRPLAHHEQQVHPLDGKAPDQLREPDVVADDKAAGDALQGEAAGAAAQAEEVVLPGGGEEVGLVVLGDDLTGAVKDIGGVVVAVGAVMATLPATMVMFSAFSRAARQEDSILQAIYSIASAIFCSNKFRSAVFLTTPLYAFTIL